MHLRTHWKAYVVGVVALVVLLGVGGPFVYTRWIAGDAAAPLAVSASEAATPTGELASAYTVGDGSEAGYRVGELLGGQRVDAVGRTPDVTGTVALSGTRVTSGEVTVQLSTVTSDQTRRDGQFTGSIMETATYPTATFTLTGPLELGADFANGTSTTVTATGTLTLKDVTREVSFPLTAVRDGANLDVSGSIPVTFTDFGIDPPSIGDFVKVDETGQVEFLLTLSPS
jgi:polyisoprenoid-binding protein YceI